MRKIILATTAAIASLIAISPAAAEGFRAELHAGYDNAGGFGTRDSGVLYGVGIGYDIKVSDKVTVGIEGDIDDSTARDCLTAGATRSCVSAGRDLALVGRVGYRVSDKATLYALAGYTNARFEGRATTGTTTVRSADNLDGIRVGVGLEYDVAKNLYAKAEYRYSNYEAGLDRHQVLTGVGFRF